MINKTTENDEQTKVIYGTKNEEFKDPHPQSIYIYYIAFGFPLFVIFVPKVVDWVNTNLIGF